MADYSFNNDASQDERKEVLENDRRAVYLVQNIRRNFRSVSLGVPRRRSTPTAAHAILLPANGEHHAESLKLNLSRRPSGSRAANATRWPCFE